ncbi:MAG TPA: class I SAM-dependent methyltransferase [Thermoanaerobaculia bacterium]|nr:class I SAM-dependent methyltransferase [Thermoanaerobaculia bacterium]
MGDPPVPGSWLRRLLHRRRPAPPLPPADLLAGIGPGDYWAVGEATVELIDRMVDIRRSDVVLDIGCGLGRIAWPLAARLGWRGRYAGLDAQRRYVDWCAAHLGLAPRRFGFLHADLRSSDTNPAGAIAPEHFAFPWANGTFTLTVATSLFTHLLPVPTAHYLREIARTLRPGGRLFSSFFLADEAGLAAIRSGRTYPVFSTPIEHAWLRDPGAPEDAVAHDAEWLRARFHDAGLRILEVRDGTWKAPTAAYYQDVVVAVREG